MVHDNTAFVDGIRLTRTILKLLVPLALRFVTHRGSKDDMHM